MLSDIIIPVSQLEKVQWLPRRLAAESWLEVETALTAWRYARFSLCYHIQINGEAVWVFWICFDIQAVSIVSTSSQLSAARCRGSHCTFSSRKIGLTISLNTNLSQCKIFESQHWQNYQIYLLFYDKIIEYCCFFTIKLLDIAAVLRLF